LIHTPPTSSSTTLSLHDALPISTVATVPDALARQGNLSDYCAALAANPKTGPPCPVVPAYLDGVDGLKFVPPPPPTTPPTPDPRDRKSTRLNSSHVSISYAVFCL